RSVPLPNLHSFPTRRSSDLAKRVNPYCLHSCLRRHCLCHRASRDFIIDRSLHGTTLASRKLSIRAKTYEKNPIQQSYCSPVKGRSEEHTSELQSRFDLVCRL